MHRLAIAAALMTFALAGTALATTGRAARVGALEDLQGPHGIQQSGAPAHMPEPAAAVLFAVGIGISAWSIRRNSKRS
jgi:hypothetical protein